jgi:hypothetical protein
LTLAKVVVSLLGGLQRKFRIDAFYLMLGRFGIETESDPMVSGMTNNSDLSDQSLTCGDGFSPMMGPVVGKPSGFSLLKLSGTEYSFDSGNPKNPFGGPVNPNPLTLEEQRNHFKKKTNSLQNNDANLNFPRRTKRTSSPGTMTMSEGYFYYNDDQLQIQDGNFTTEGLPKTPEPPIEILPNASDSNTSDPNNISPFLANFPQTKESETLRLGPQVISEISHENLSIDQKLNYSTDRDFNLSKLSSEAAGRKDSETAWRKASDFMITEVPAKFVGERTCTGPDVLQTASGKNSEKEVLEEARVVVNVKGLGKENLGANMQYVIELCANQSNMVARLQRNNNDKAGVLRSSRIQKLLISVFDSQRANQ